MILKNFKNLKDLKFNKAQQQERPFNTILTIIKKHQKEDHIHSKNINLVKSKNPNQENKSKI